MNSREFGIAELFVLCTSRSAISLNIYRNEVLAVSDLLA